MCVSVSAESWTPDPSGRTRKGLGNNLTRKCLAGMPQFLNPANFIFRPSTRLVRYYSNFQNFYVLPYIHFLSSVELERWLAEMRSSSRDQQGLGSRLVSVESWRKELLLWLLVHAVENITYIHASSRLRTSVIPCWVVTASENGVLQFIQHLVEGGSSEPDWRASVSCIDNFLVDADVSILSYSFCFSFIFR